MSFLRVVGPPYVAVDYTNDTDAHRDIDYASVTAAQPTFVQIELWRVGATEPEVVDGVHISSGGSHSWWAGAHGKLLKRGLMPGERLRVVGDGAFAFRWDWTDE